MTVDTRQKNKPWRAANADGSMDYTHAKVALLMDIRDELQANGRRMDQLIGLASCYRIPRALDAMYELGKDLRKKKRETAKRKAARSPTNPSE